MVVLHVKWYYSNIKVIQIVAHLWNKIWKKHYALYTNRNFKIYLLVDLTINPFCKSHQLFRKYPLSPNFVGENVNSNNKTRNTNLTLFKKTLKYQTILG